MDDNRKKWIYSRDNLMKAIKQLGFPESLGDAIVKNLGSPQAMDMMTSYLLNARPNTAELVVDEMLAIMSNIETWKNKKQSLEANAKYNEMLYYGFDDE